MLFEMLKTISLSYDISVTVYLSYNISLNKRSHGINGL